MQDKTIISKFNKYNFVQLLIKGEERDASRVNCSVFELGSFITRYTYSRYVELGVCTTVDSVHETIHIAHLWNHRNGNFIQTFRQWYSNLEFRHKRDISSVLFQNVVMNKTNTWCEGICCKRDRWKTICVCLSLIVTEYKRGIFI